MSKYKKEIEKILDSSEFRNSASYKKLLIYLYEAAEQDKHLSENIIAFDVFGRDSHFNPSEDTIVRVYIHELRRKLNIFYKTEGRKEKIRLEIPKGCYDLTFTEANSLNITTGKKFVLQILVSLLVISIMFNIFLAFKKNQIRKSYQLIPRNDPIWSDYINDEKPVLIVLGNLFFFREYSPELGRYRNVRDLDINSREQLDLEYSQKFKDYPDNIQDIEYSYLVEFGAWGLMDLLPVFYSYHKDVELRLSTEIMPRDLCDYNIIYIGYFRALGILNTYFENSSLEIKQERKIILKSEDSDSIFTFSSSGLPREEHTDLAIAVKFPGPNDNVIFLLAGFTLTGTMQIIENLTFPSNLMKFENLFIDKYYRVPQFFECVYHVHGLQRTGLSSKVEYINEIFDDKNYLSLYE